jgi:hypothetical protein
MNLKLISKYFSIALVSLLIISCSDDDDVVDNTVTPPSDYTFERSGATSVSYSGQTARLKMAIELSGAMNSSTATKTGLTNMFDNGTGFSDATLDATGKKVGGKTFASATASSTVKPKFDAWIVDFIDNVQPKFAVTATNGSAGVLVDAGSTKKRYVNANGHELNQLFTKGLIGGMATDQIVNGYLSPAKLNGAKADNDAGTMYAEGKNYTAMEHYWDEGFGYLYGLDSQKSPTLGAGGDVLLNKYAKKIEDKNSPGIAKIIYDAFVLGRAAIVAKNYTVRDAQAKIIQINISKIIGFKAVDYLEDYVSKATAGAGGSDEWRAAAFHSLSEGYGFILSLQVTNDGTGKPYFTNAEVNTMLAKMSNFWTVSNSDLTAMAADIKSKMALQ